MLEYLHEAGVRRGGAAAALGFDDFAAAVEHFRIKG
jgi:hypothetical protein